MKKIGFILIALFSLSSFYVNAQSCPSGQTRDDTVKTCVLPEVTVTPPNEEDKTVNGITIGPNCLLNGQCKFNVYDTLGIRKSIRAEQDPTSVGLFVQDIILAATTFIGSILTLAIIVSGLMYIFAAASGKDPAKAKSGLINAFIGLLIVILSYSIIRLVQYLAKGV